MKFELDEDKNTINKEKHKISFETAAYVFDDPYYIEMFDFEHSVDEVRYIAIGKVGDALRVVFTEKRYNSIDFSQTCNKCGKAFIMTKTFIIENGQKPTDEQLKEIEDAKNNSIVFDEDCEELSPAMMKAFKSAVVQRNRKKKA